MYSITRAEHEGIKFPRLATISNVLVFVDLQDFTVREKFTVKEVAILRNGKELTHRVFREAIFWNLLTKAEKSRACWVTANHHGLQWSNSDVAYRFSKPVIQNGVCDQSRDAPRRVYVKGLEKKKWLEEILGGNVIADHDVIVETIDADLENIGASEHPGRRSRFPLRASREKLRHGERVQTVRLVVKMTGMYHRIVMSR
ncbi:hypothetical protein P5V15_004337 [Pogonomyrmex californicus]